MEPGRFRHRVRIQNYTTVRDASGQELETWEDGPIAPAEVKGISGREIVSAGAETAEATVRVWMRFRKDVTAASRLLCLSGPYEGLTLDIVGPPIPDTTGRRLEILCKQGVKRD